MNEWFNKLLERIKSLWSGSTLVQKIILFAVVGGVVVALFLAVSFSAAPTRVPLLGTPVTDQAAFQAITAKLDQEGVDYTTSEDNRIFVENEGEAQRMKAILFRENLVPAEVDPWEIFDIERWTLTDFERDVNLRRALTAQLEQHILALDDVDDVNVNLVIPEERLFSEDQNPVTASVRISPKPGSDITENRAKIEGIVQLIKFGVEGLNEETIVITDQRGIMLNDFAGLEELDRLNLGNREMKQKRQFESEYKQTILEALQKVFTPDRVQIVDLNISLDTDEVTTVEEVHTPIVRREDDPTTPYSELDTVDSIPISTSSRQVEFRGTGFNPQGPAGMEGQTPPAYQDLDNLVGEYTENDQTNNFAVNRAESTRVESPWQISRVTIGVALDGVWRKVYDDEGELVVEPNGSISREYEAITDEQIRSAQELIAAAVGYDEYRGDTVTVRHLQFDRTSEHLEEDDELRAKRQFESFLLWSVVGLAVILLGFIISRLIAREMERRRRLREEELSRQHQAMREAALRSAEEEGVDVEMSVAERARLEMQENAINMAREHPEEVAQLIRTWLNED